MFSINTVLIDNHAADSPFAKEILFTPTASIMIETLLKVAGNKIFSFSAANSENTVYDGAENFSYEGSMKDIFRAELDAEHVLVMSAAMPTLTKQNYEALLRFHMQNNADITILGDNDGIDNFIVSLDGAYVFPCAVFKKDVLKLCENSGGVISAVSQSLKENARVYSFKVKDAFEIRDNYDVYIAQKSIMEQVNKRWMKNGVHIVSPETTYIAPDAVIGRGASILPNTMIKTCCVIGENAVIGPNTVIEMSSIGDGSRVNASQVFESSVGRNTTVGPFAYIRPLCSIGDGVRIGDFVEVKKSKIGNGTKVSHLTYIGDAVVGERVNFGCGTVVVNYDGYDKHTTVIGDDAFIGCNTNLVSPVTVGSRAFTAAGATITTDVPDGALAVSRVRQENKEGWNDRRRKLKSK